MNAQLGRESFGWGFALWLFGYVLGFAFFPLFSANALGWAIMPFGIAATLWVLLRKLGPKPMVQYFLLAVIWTLLAIVLDYAFIVKLLNPADGYYKLDVFIYYALTFALPCVVGFWRSTAE